MCGEENYRATLATLWTQTFLYGIYSLLFAGYVYTYWSSRTSATHNNKYLLFTAIAMFALSSALMFTNFTIDLLTPHTTVNQVCDTVQCTQCNPDLDDPWEDNILNLQQIITDVLFTTSQLIADGLLIYRCFILWRHRLWIIVLPILVVLATAIAGYVQANAIAQLYLIVIRNESTTSHRFYHYYDLAYSLAFVTSGLSLGSNLLLTGIIAFRIGWLIRSLDKASGERSDRRYHSIIVMMIESGAIYSMATLILMILTKYAAQPYGELVQCVIYQLVGIVPTLIMLRVALGRGVEEATRHDDKTSLVFASSTAGANINSRTRKRRSSILFATRPVPFNDGRDVETLTRHDPDESMAFGKQDKERSAERVSAS